ncbi:MAG: 2-oxo acid dehydrogenase subunit E2, partial [Chthonomonas sp.]|nr:2-oxo acid dehydrogenase subunit E2 [Chthonomonas sp.]
QPGDRIKRDEPIYQMETDKAVMDVESPYEGVLTSWSAVPDTLLPIGGEIAKMEVAEGTPEMAAGHGPAPAPAAAPTSDSTTANMATVRIPMIGEGLQEARLVAVLKQPGDMIKRDEPIYQMETDKAVMDVESPFEGKLVEWLAPVDTLLQIGAAVATMEVGHPVVDTPVHGAPAAAATPVSPVVAAPVTSERRRDIPPRTRAYGKEKGLSDDQLATIPAQGSKLMPADIDAFLAGSAPVVKPSGNFDERPLGQKQRLLSSRLQRGSQLVVPGTITVATNWEQIEDARAKIKASGSEFQPSAFTMFAFAVARALADFPMFRSTLVGDSVLRTYRHANLGIAVALPGDELVLAVVNDADTMSWKTFAAACKAQIDLARQGTDQANESVTISLTNMQAFGLRDAAPVVVPPSVATLFLGEVYNGLAQDTQELQLRRYVNLALTFDHRLINGVGAAEFINSVKRNVETIQEVMGQ